MKKKAYRDAFVQAHLSDTIAAQIAALREAKGWTQKTLAAKSDMKQSRISTLEDPNYGNLEIETLRKLASAFDVGLMVRFVPFSELAFWSASLSPSKIAVASFDDEADEAVAAKEPIGDAARKMALEQYSAQDALGRNTGSARDAAQNKGPLNQAPLQ